MLLSFFLQASGSSFSFIFPAIILATVYFFFLRPQIKKQKEQNLFTTSLQKGDEVVTASGIIGQINKIDEHSISLELDNKTYIRVVPSSISKEMTDAYKSSKK